MIKLYGKTLDVLSVTRFIWTPRCYQPNRFGCSQPPQTLSNHRECQWVCPELHPSGHTDQKSNNRNVPCIALNLFQSTFMCMRSIKINFQYCKAKLVYIGKGNSWLYIYIYCVSDYLYVYCASLASATKLARFSSKTEENWWTSKS